MSNFAQLAFFPSLFIYWPVSFSLSFDPFSCPAIDSTACARPEATQLLTGATMQQSRESAQNNKYVCIDEIKMSVMAKSCLCPGITTMIHSLVSSSRSAPNSEEENWVGEYSAGCAFEVYCIPISPAFSGCSFVDAARIVYQETESLLFALEINPPDALSRLMINPAEYEIPNTKDYSVYGFVLATDVHNAEVLTDGSRKDVDQMLSELGPHADVSCNCALGESLRNGGRGDLTYVLQSKMLAVAVSDAWPPLLTLPLTLLLPLSFCLVSLSLCLVCFLKSHVDMQVPFCCCLLILFFRVST
jgi:hypothetical protein